MISPLDSSFLRGLLRVYFVLAFIIIGLIGSQCCKCSVKVGLAHGRSIKLNRMTGWIGGPSLIKAIWQLRRLPGGVFFGLLMIVTSIVTLVADFATSTLVYQKSVYNRCPFDTGLVIDHTVKWWDVPPPFSAARVVAENSQLISTINGGYVGIYKKASYAIDFAAEEKDLMGWWTCSEEVGKDVTYKSLPEPDGFDDNNISLDLLKLGLQYPNAWMVSDGHDTLGTAHLIIWSANAVDGSESPFDVRVSVDQGTTYGKDKPMKNYHCIVDTRSSMYDEVNIILSSMSANATMKDWVTGLSSSIYNGLNSGPNTANTTDFLAQTLNTLTMVQGGFGSILSKPKAGEDPTYGCLVPKTYISIVVIALACAVGGTLLFLFCYWMFLLARLGASNLPFTKSRKRRSALRPVPHDLVGWMLHATRESTMGFQEKQFGAPQMDVGMPEEEKQTREWRYEVISGPGVVAGELGPMQYSRLVRADGRNHPTVEVVPSPGYTGYPPPPTQQVQWDPNSKQQGKYGLVPTDGRYTP